MPGDVGRIPATTSLSSGFDSSMVSEDSTVRDEKERTEEVSALSHNENNELNRVTKLLKTPGNLRSSWKLLKNDFFFQFPLEISWKITGSPGFVISVSFVKSLLF